MPYIIKDDKIIEYEEEDIITSKPTGYEVDGVPQMEDVITTIRWKTTEHKLSEFADNLIHDLNNLRAETEAKKLEDLAKVIEYNAFAQKVNEIRVELPELNLPEAEII